MVSSLLLPALPSSPLCQLRVVMPAAKRRSYPETCMEEYFDIPGQKVIKERIKASE